MTGKNRVKWKIIETDATPLLVREETALQLSAGSLDFITHLSSDSYTFSMLFQNRNELPDFIHIRRIELDMFRTINGDKIEWQFIFPVRRQSSSAFSGEALISLMSMYSKVTLRPVVLK